MKKLMIMTAALAVMAAPLAYANESIDLNEKPQHKGGGKMFKKADENGDGVVSKKEFLASVESRFDKIDADKNGEITPEEARAHAKSRHGERKERREERKNKKGDE